MLKSEQISSLFCIKLGNQHVSLMSGTHKTCVLITDEVFFGHEHSKIWVLKLIYVLAHMHTAHIP